MLKRFIPAFNAEFQSLSDVATAGLIMGFGISTSSNPDHLLNTYPPSWRSVYEEKNYLYSDPVVAWLLQNDGQCRWSEIDMPDPRGILEHAKQYGLRFGAVISVKVGLKRCFLAISRPDREIRNEEMSLWSAKFAAWCPLVVEERIVLNERELAVLRGLLNGLNHTEIAASLGISVPTVRQRQTTAMHKLGAKTSHSAVGLAATYQLL